MIVMDFSSKRKLQNLLLELKPVGACHTLPITPPEEPNGTERNLIDAPLMGKEECDKTECI
jgi:hypothetical protein